MPVPKPHILSIHPTMQCDYHCHGCYLKRDEDDNKTELAPEFFVELIKQAKALGMKEIAIPANYVNLEGKDPSEDKNFVYFNLLKKTCNDVKIEFTCTVNYDFVLNYIDSLDLVGVSLMSVSINDFVTGTPDKRKQALEIMKKIRRVVPTVNCNLMVTPNMVKQLNDGLMEELLNTVDTIYLLVQKPVIVPMDTIKDWLSGLEQYFDMIDERIILDSCLKSAFGLTNGVCSKHQLIYVNPYGEIKRCSYDSKGIFDLKKPEDLTILYNEHYPAERLFNCELLEFNRERA